MACVEMTDCVGKAGGEVQFVCVTGDVCESVCWWKASDVCVSFVRARNLGRQSVIYSLLPPTSNLQPSISTENDRD